MTGTSFSVVSTGPLHTNASVMLDDEYVLTQVQQVGGGLFCFCLFFFCFFFWWGFGEDSPLFLLIFPKFLKEILQ